jgi:hypothetical protein
MFHGIMLDERMSKLPGMWLLYLLLKVVNIN